MKDDTGEEFTFEKGMKDFAARSCEEFGIVPLKPGELRPPGYYMVDHYWGLPPKRVKPPKDRSKR
jgi:hypothetical protein